MRASLGLGTVQFGMTYGIANSNFELNVSRIGEILRAAQRNGVAHLDTAEEYGSSEIRLGQHDLTRFKVVTKLASLKGLTASEIRTRVVNGAKLSLAKLGINQLDGFLIHDADDFIGATGDAVSEALQEIKSVGLVNKIGVSVYNERQVDEALRRPVLDLIQLPVNVLDQRFVRSGHIAELYARGVEVHARSVYLQGLLLMDLDTVPTRFAEHEALRLWHQAVAYSGMSRIEAALSYVRNLKDIAVVLIGAVSAQQVEAAARAYADAPLFDAESLACSDLNLIDPRRWTE